jgi:hypothetical protein
MIIYKYNEAKRPEGEFITGVPLTDLTAEMVESYPPHIQATLKTILYYEPVKPAKPAKEAQPNV